MMSKVKNRKNQKSKKINIEQWKKKSIARIALCLAVIMTVFAACGPAKKAPTPTSGEEFDYQYLNDIVPEGLTVSSGGYKQKGDDRIVSTQNSSWAIVNGSSFKGGTLSTTVREGIASDSGIIFNRTKGTGGTNYYCLQINKEGILMFARIEISWVSVFSYKIPDFKLGVDYKIAVTREDGTFKFYLNGEYMGKYVDPNPLPDGPYGYKADRRNTEFTFIEQSDEVYTVSSYADEFDILSGGYMANKTEISVSQPALVGLKKNTSFTKGTVSAKFTYQDVWTQGGLIFGVTEKNGSAASFYALSREEDKETHKNTLTLFRVDYANKSAWQGIGQFQDAKITHGKPCTLSVEWDGSAIRCYLDGDLVIATSDSNPLTGNRVGFRLANGTKAKMSDFAVSNKFSDVKNYASEFDILSGGYTATKNDISLTGGDLIGLKKNTEFTNGTISGTFVFLDEWTQGGLIFGATEVSGKLKTFYIFSREEDKTTHKNTLTLFRVDYTKKPVEWKGIGGFQDAKISHGNPCKLSVEKDGSVIRCYLDDQLVIAANDDNPLPGKRVGYRLSNGAKGKFSNFKVSDKFSDIKTYANEFDILSGGYMATKDEISIMNGALVGLKKNASFSSGTLSASFVFSDKWTQGGLLFGVTEEGGKLESYYYLNRTEDTLTLFRVAPENGELKWTGIGRYAGANITFGKPCTLAVERVGTSFRCYLDGQLIITAIDRNVLSGTRTGFRLSNGTSGKLSKFTVSDKINQVPCYADEFDILSGNYLSNDTEVSIVDGDLIGLKKNTKFNRGTISGTFTFSDDKTQGGLLFGATENAENPGRLKTYYYLNRTGNNLTLFRVDTSLENPWVGIGKYENESVAQGTPLLLSVEWDGSRIRCYLDGKLVIATTDNNPFIGTRTGFRFSNGSKGKISKFTISDELSTTYADEFDILSGNYLSNDTEVSIVDGDLVGLKKNTNSNRGTISGTFTFSDDNTQGGLLFGATENAENPGRLKTYYYLNRRENILTLFRLDMSKENPWTGAAMDSYTDDKVAQDTPLALSVEWGGRTIRCYLDGELVISVGDSEPLTGTRVGFRLSNGSQGKMSDFDVSDHLSPTYADDFDIISGGYTATQDEIVSAGGQLLGVKKNTEFNRGTVSATFTFTDNTIQGGLAFGITKAEEGVEAFKSYYLLQRDGVNINLWRNNDWKNLGGYSKVNIEKNVPFTLSVRWDGTNIRCYLNGELIITATDITGSSLTGTGVGFRFNKAGAKVSNLTTSNIFNYADEFDILSGTYNSTDDDISFKDFTKDALLGVKKDTVFSRGTVSAKFTFTEELAQGGLAFGITKKEGGFQSYYVLNREHTTLTLFRNGVPLGAHDVGQELQLKEEFTLSVEWDGKNIRCFFNGKLIIRATDDDPLTGTGVGFRFGNALNSKISDVTTSDHLTTYAEGFDILYGEHTSTYDDITGVEGGVFGLKKDSEFTSGTISGKFVFPGDSTVGGLVFGATEEGGLPTSYYILQREKNTITLFHVDESKPEKEKWRGIDNYENEIVSQDNSLALSVEWDSPTIRCYLNGQLIISATDTEPLSGKRAGFRLVGSNCKVSEFATSDHLTTYAEGFEIISGEYTSTYADITITGGALEGLKKETTFNDGTVSATFVFPVGTQGGIVFGATREGNKLKSYYYLNRADSTLNLFRVDMAEENPWDNSLGSYSNVSITPDKPYTLTVEKGGKSIRCYLDGTLLIIANDPKDPLSGTDVGFRLSNGVNGKVSNFIIPANKDDFNTYDKNFDILSGGYTATADEITYVDGSKELLGVKKGTSFDYGTVSAKFTFTEEKAQGGLAFGITKAKNKFQSYYILSRDGTKLILFRIDDGIWKKLHEEDMIGKLTLTKKFTLSVRWNRSTICCYFDGESIFDVTDETPLTGTDVGFRFANGVGTKVSDLTTSKVFNYADEFDFVSGNYNTTDDEVSFKDFTKDALLGVKKDTVFSRGTVSAKFTFTEEKAQGGLAFGITKGQGKFESYYVLNRSGTTLTLQRCAPDLTNLGSYNMDKKFTLNKGFTVSIEWEGTTIRCYFNGELIITAKDDSLLTGTGVGFRFANGLGSKVSDFTTSNEFIGAAGAASSQPAEKAQPGQN